MLVAACAITVAQESRPFGLLPQESPLAPIQEALLRGDSLEARAALDAFLGSASPEVLVGLAPQASLLRAASEPVPQRAEAMLGVAITFADRPVAEAACVAGIAALLSDGPEVGDLAEPLLARPAATGRPDADPALGALSGARRDRLLGGFLDVLERRVQALTATARRSTTRGGSSPSSLRRLRTGRGCARPRASPFRPVSTRASASGSTGFPSATRSPILRARSCPRARPRSI